MRLYHYTHFDYGLDDILNHHIKVSTLDSVNDPHEWSFVIKEVPFEYSLSWWKDYYKDKYGFICFCKACDNPVMWSHYGNKHSGIVLGFDCESENILEVDYKPDRLSLDGLEAMNEKERFEHFKRVIKRKFSDWSYEEEYRGFVSLQEQCHIRLQGGKLMYFQNIDEFSTLKEVIIGCDAVHRVNEVRNVFNFGKWADPRLPELKVAQISQNYRMDILGYDEWQQKRFGVKLASF